MKGAKFCLCSVTLPSSTRPGFSYQYSRELILQQTSTDILFLYKLAMCAGDSLTFRQQKTNKSFVFPKKKEDLVKEFKSIMPVCDGRPAS